MASEFHTQAAEPPTWLQNFPHGLLSHLHGLRTSHMDCLATYMASEFPTQTAQPPIWPQDFPHGLLSHLHGFRIPHTHCSATYMASEFPPHTAQPPTWLQNFPHTLLSHLHGFRISHMIECPCGRGPQTTEHILQLCPACSTLWCQTCQQGLGLKEKTFPPLMALPSQLLFCITSLCVVVVCLSVSVCVCVDQCNVCKNSF